MNKECRQGLPEFHLVIPCFEESKRLPDFLLDLVSHLDHQPYRTNILVVDDGSREAERKKTQMIVNKMSASHSMVLEPIYLENNTGKGFAVRAGWQAGKTARWLAFVDADGATPASDVMRVFDMIHRENNPMKCYLGSRLRTAGSSIERNWKRHLAGRIYATFAGMFIGEILYDFQCGFKVVSQPAFHSIFPYLRENRFAFDIEMMLALADSGYAIEEVPVNWRDIPGSKVSILRDSGLMLKSLFEIKQRRRERQADVVK
jgi:glycosyltransferase involved in cell wall biosynthesis